MVNPGVDDYTKPKSTANLRKTQKRDNILRTNRILKPKYKPSGGLVFTFN